MGGMSSRMIMVGICAWISVCLLIAGWLPDASNSISKIWLISGLTGLISAVGLAEAIKGDIRKQESLIKEYMRAAMTDGLTGLANRQSLDRTLTSAMKKFDSRRSPLCLIMIDIDHFKVFNDSHGHQAGDAVLRFMSNRMAEFFEEKGYAARYGGEEFAVVLPSVRLEEADHLAEQFRRIMKTAICEFRDQKFQVTISAGVTEAVTGDSPESLIRRTDLALYAAKRLGRDCIWVSDPHSADVESETLEQMMDRTPAKILKTT